MKKAYVREMSGNDIYWQMYSLNEKYTSIQTISPQNPDL